MTVNAEVATLDPEEVATLTPFLEMHLVQQDGISIWSYLGTEPDHRFDRDHEKEEG